MSRDFCQAFLSSRIIPRYVSFSWRADFTARFDCQVQSPSTIPHSTVGLLAGQGNVAIESLREIESRCESNLLINGPNCVLFIYKKQAPSRCNKYNVKKNRFLESCMHFPVISNQKRSWYVKKWDFFQMKKFLFLLKNVLSFRYKKKHGPSAFKKTIKNCFFCDNMLCLARVLYIKNFFSIWGSVFSFKRCFISKQQCGESSEWNTFINF